MCAACSEEEVCHVPAEINTGHGAETSTSQYNLLPTGRPVCSFNILVCMQCITTDKSASTVAPGTWTGKVGQDKYLRLMLLCVPLIFYLIFSEAKTE